MIFTGDHIHARFCLRFGAQTSKIKKTLVWHVYKDQSSGCCLPVKDKHVFRDGAKQKDTSERGCQGVNGAGAC